MADLTRDVLLSVVSHAQSGFHAHDPMLFYDAIIKDLDGIDDERVAGIRRMAQGASSLISKRFAHPHIESRARDLLQQFPMEGVSYG